MSFSCKGTEKNKQVENKSNNGYPKTTSTHNTGKRLIYNDVKLKTGS